MDLPEIVEIWARSLRLNFESAGVEVVSQRSPPERPNPSVALNLRKGAIEADLLVWASGHVDLCTMSANGVSEQKHFEDLSTVEAIGDVLAIVARLLMAPEKA
jgi:hypothetical protein